MEAHYATKVTTEEENFTAPDKVKLYRLQDLFTDYDSLTPEEKQINQYRVRL